VRWRALSKNTGSDLNGLYVFTVGIQRLLADADDYGLFESIVEMEVL
jgi:hypothetical protein